MGFRVEERFAVQAPAEAVWAYLTDPRRVVTCLPGAELTEVIDPRTFNGTVKVKVGPVTVSYRGRVQLIELDEGARRVKLVGEGRESAGAGSAKMTMVSTLATAGAETTVSVQADVDVVGRAVQLGRGMMEQVSAQLFRQFAACVRTTLESEARQAAPAAAGTAPPGTVTGAPSPTAEGAATAPPAPLARSVEPVRAIPLLLRALLATVGAFFRRLFGGRG